jgi:hypothetical protein
MAGSGSGIHHESSQPASRGVTRKLRAPNGRSSRQLDWSKSTTQYDPSARMRPIRCVEPSGLPCWRLPAPRVCWWLLSRLFMPVCNRQKSGIGRASPMPMLSGVVTTLLVRHSARFATFNVRPRAKPKTPQIHRVSPMLRMCPRRGDDRRGFGQSRDGIFCAMSMLLLCPWRHG